MENDVKRAPLDDMLGADNADILKAKRTRAIPTAEVKLNSGSDAVSAAQLQTRMKRASSSDAIPIAKRPTAAPSKGTQPVKARPAVQSAAPQGRSATASKAAPAVSRPVQKQMPVSAEKRAVPAAKSVKSTEPVKPVAENAPRPAVSGQKPARTPASSPENNSRTIPFKVIYADQVKKSEKKQPVSQNAAAIHALIPHQKAEIHKKGDDENTATRVTDMSLSLPSDATRVSKAQPVIPDKKQPRPDREEEESEGGNTIISVIKAITYMVSIVVVSVFLAVFVILVGNDIYALVKDEAVIEISVPEYATLNDVSELLYENGIIEYPNVFKIYANLKKDNGQFIAGSYPISPTMNYDELLAAFKPKKATGTSRITIPEGYTTDQIIDLFVSKGIGTREGYVEAINNYDFDYWFIDELEENGWKDGRYYRLDGYLFPDTYEFYNASTEVVVINKLLKRFNEVFIESYAIKAKELGYTVDEILTLASMVEKEGGTQADFFNISSVFNNRLKNAARYPYLECDATIVYALEHETGEHVNPTKEHLSYQTPYNTHTNKGLPPGPISNPSASAIRAALYPADTDYYFFVSASATVTYYASTLDEHNANVQKAASARG